MESQDSNSVLPTLFNTKMRGMRNLSISQGNYSPLRELRHKNLNNSKKGKKFKEIIEVKLPSILLIIFPNKIIPRYNIISFFLSFKENDVGRNINKESTNMITPPIHVITLI